MSIVTAIILGIIQGTTEFLPVSSSGHLIVIPKLLNIDSGGFSFDAFLHLATGLAIVSYFFPDYKKLLTKALAKDKSAQKQVTYLIIGCIPAGIIGLIFGDFIENKMRGEFVVAGALFIVALAIILVEKYLKNQKREVVTKKDGVIVGLSQVLALIPGVSRSGITIISGMAGGLTREASAKFSFMLATPIVLLAGAYSFYQALPYLDYNQLLSYAVGFITAFFAGIFSIEFLLSYVKTKSLMPFAIYRIALASIVIVTAIFL